MKKSSLMIVIAAALFALFITTLVYLVRQNKELAESKAAIEGIQSELVSSRNSEAELKDRIYDRNQEMSIILSELAAISGRTSSLKVDVESGSASISQAQQIEENIAAIKKRISDLEKAGSSASKKDREFQTVIENFKKVVAQQEQQINSLKEEIRQKDILIADQQTTIDRQQQTIGIQKKNLDEMVAAQAKALFDAGVTLEQIADDAPQVSWKKNRQKLDEMSQSIYRKAREYYTMALEAGYEPASEALASVDEKIRTEE